MCAIHGIVGYAGRPRDWAIRSIGKMMAAAAHRGPDSQTVFEQGDAVFGFSRLAIVAPDRDDLIHRDASRQRMAIFNGEIVNHRTLRVGLAVDPGSSDGAVILPLYEREGSEFAKLLAGMFAIAIYDGRERVLELVRDPLGIKPLYYHHSDEGLIFSSEVKAIYAVLDRALEPDFGAIDHVLTCRFHAGPDTVFREIRRVAPGERLVYAAGRLRRSAYWSALDIPARQEASDEAELTAFYRELIAEYCQADVEGGFFVSGGLDSSLVAAVALEQPSRFRTPISIRFSPKPVEDEQFAALLEQKLGVPFEWVSISDETARSALCELVSKLDEPLENPIHVGTYLMARRAKEVGIKTVLTGDGSDEFFLGYDRHAVWFDGKPAPAQRYAEMNRTLSPEDTQALYLPESRAKMSPMISYQGVPLHAIDSVETMLAYERVDRLVEYHCMRLDRMTMGCGLEARVPFLDHRLVEKVLSIPRGQLFGGGGKAVLQRIAQGWVPTPIVHRKKVHFPSLPDQWLRGPGLRWAKDILLDPNAGIANWLNVSALERYLREHGEGVRNRGRVLWAVVVLELWCRSLKGWRAVETDLQRTQSKC